MSNDTLTQLAQKLEQLESSYKKERAALEVQMSDLRKSQQAAVLSKIRTLMEENHISADQLQASEKGKKRNSKKPVSPKFKGPNGETWSGRGRQPAWLGSDKEKFRIAP